MARYYNQLVGEPFSLRTVQRFLSEKGVLSLGTGEKLPLYYFLILSREENWKYQSDYYESLYLTQTC